MNKVDQVFDEALAVLSGDAAQRLEDQQNAYADSKIRAEREAWYSWRPEHDADTFGRPLRAGS